MSSNRRNSSLAAIAVAAMLSGGIASLASSASSSSSPPDTARGWRGAEAGNTGAFSWLRAGRVPHGWTSATIASGAATISYPASWKPISGDPGTVTAALRDRTGAYRGYLNVTPAEGVERLFGWAAFRAARNREDGDRHLRVIAAAEGLRFGQARGSCVIDDYRSRVGSHPYREVACIVAGARHTSVFVGATLRPDWPRLEGVIERAAAALAEH
jgi:hypothetical protein